MRDKRTEKALRLISILRKKIDDLFDNGELAKAIKNVHRYNCINRSICPFMEEVSPGMMLDSFLMNKTFEAQL